MSGGQEHTPPAGALDAKALRERILGAEDLERVRVECPEWGEGCHVYVRTLTVGQRNAMEIPLGLKLRKLPDSPHDDGQRARALTAAFIVACCVDAQGVPLFTDADADALNGKAAKPVARLMDVADRLNGLTTAAVEKLSGN